MQWQNPMFEAFENIDIYDVNQLDNYEILKEMLFKAERTFQSFLTVKNCIWADRKIKRDLFRQI